MKLASDTVYYEYCSNSAGSIFCVVLQIIYRKFLTVCVRAKKMTYKLSSPKIFLVRYGSTNAVICLALAHAQVHLAESNKFWK